MRAELDWIECSVVAVIEILAILGFVDGTCRSGQSVKTLRRQEEQRTRIANDVAGKRGASAPASGA